MHLTTGTRLGPYEITAPLGAGGMGEVYRANDSRLGTKWPSREPQPINGGDPQDRPMRWRDDGRVLFVRQGQLSAQIFALDVASGQRTPVSTVGPRDTVGVDSVADTRLSPDGKSYAYVYIRSLYSLYQVTSLK